MKIDWQGGFIQFITPSYDKEETYWCDDKLADEIRLI